MENRLRTLKSLISWLPLCAWALAQDLPAMELRIHHQPELNVRMVIAEGRIEPGDAERFRAVARLADRDGEGLVMLLLTSPGGNVEAAFRFVDVMDDVRVYTVVPNNASCASACASILFASGVRRSILGSGRLGFHSCYRRKGTAYLDDSLCNEIIAANAMQRGISHAAINRFTSDFGARDMAWVGRSTACRFLEGLCNPGHLERKPEAMRAVARSLDCSKLVSTASRLVCGDTELSRADDELAAALALAMRSGNKVTIRNAQRVWLREQRNVCTDKNCLLRAYLARIAEVRSRPAGSDAK